MIVFLLSKYKTLKFLQEEKLSIEVFYILVIAEFLCVEAPLLSLLHALFDLWFSK